MLTSTGDSIQVVTAANAISSIEYNSQVRVMCGTLYMAVYYFIEDDVLL